MSSNLVTMQAFNQNYSKWDKYKTKEYYFNEGKYSTVGGGAFSIAGTIIDSIFMATQKRGITVTKILAKSPKLLATNFAIGTIGFFVGRIMGDLIWDIFSKDK